MMPFLAVLTLLAIVPAAHAATATYGMTSRPDYVDPALAYTLEGWSIVWAAYTPLLTYEHADGEAGTRLVPGLAQTLPEVSPDGLTYTLRLRDGLRYSDGTAVRARDFEHAVKRTLFLESEASQFFLAIRGARTYVAGRRARGDISGIVTDDAARTIAITLSAPDGAFANVLAMPHASLVPATTRFGNLSSAPPPGVGPYFVARSSRRSLVLERNPGFAVPGLPAAGLDAITVRYGAPHGSVDVHFDTPPARLRTGDGYLERDALWTSWFFLDHRRWPFSNVDVRRAVSLALDRPGLAALLGAPFRAGCAFLPPELPGHGAGGCPPLDVAGARQMVRAAGAEAELVNVYGSDIPAVRAATIAFARALRSIGLRTRVRIVEASIYFLRVGKSTTPAHAGYATWSADFPHPANFLSLLDGDAIRSFYNPNLGHVDDAELNALIDAVRAAPADRAAEPAAAAERRIADEAHIAAVGSRRHGFLFSARVPPQCRALHPLYTVDLARLCVA